MIAAGECKHVRREGESCMLNNNCKYPACIQGRGIPWGGLTKEDLEEYDKLIQKLDNEDRG